MTSRDFAYWLQGFFEISGENKGMSSEQATVVQKHLAMVFLHEIDPSFGEDNEELDKIHNGQFPHLDFNRVYEEGEPRMKC